MPAVSVDTFFACALMVILVVSAMATTSKILYPHLNNDIDMFSAERYAEISKYLLLEDGAPSNWGQSSATIPETFGIAKTDSHDSYNLDIDKVSRLNSENLYAISYAQIFAALKMPDISFRIEIGPIFDVVINLTSTFEETNETIYQFKISTEKHGVPIQTELKCYAIAEDYLEASSAHVSDGNVYLNMTISNSVNGPALLVAFAKTVSNDKIVSFGTYAFTHSSVEPEHRNAFLRLSPLNYSLNASLTYSGITLLKTYALTFNYHTILIETSNTDQSVTYNIPHYLDTSPTLLVATGWNTTTFFTEWTTYPQVPLQTGVNFVGLATLSNVFASTYIVAINSLLYECTVWFGGPRK